MALAVEILKEAAKQVLAVFGRLIMDAGGTDKDLAELKLRNLEEIDRVLAEESRIADRVKAILAEKDPPKDPTV